MAGTKEGGIKARDTNYLKNGEDFYKRIGSIGGSKGLEHGVLKGFALNKELAREAGKIGGKLSRRSR